jgi:hypothetical protein
MLILAPIDYSILNQFQPDRSVILIRPRVGVLGRPDLASFVENRSVKYTFLRHTIIILKELQQVMLVRE